MQEKSLPKATQSRIRAYYSHKYKSKIYFNERELQVNLSRLWGAAAALCLSVSVGGGGRPG